MGSKVFLTVVSILNAARNSFSFFLLLIVCMGYGVVKPSLGRAMLWARALALVQFVFGVIYSITSHLIAPETAGMLKTHTPPQLPVGTAHANSITRTLCSSHRPSACWNADRLLRLDAELAEAHAEGLERAKANHEGIDV